VTDGLDPRVVVMARRARATALALIAAVVLAVGVTVAVLGALDALAPGGGYTCSEMRERPKRFTREATAITKSIGVYDLPLDDCDRECRKNFTRASGAIWSRRVAKATGTTAPARRSRPR
jgi:hypothetical protein